MGRVVVFAALAILLLSASLYHPANAASAKDFEVTSQNYLGQADMTVAYNASATAVVGDNLTVGVEVYVGNFTGSDLYVRDYVLVATLFSDDHSTNASVGSPAPTQRFLYPGARWGPFIVSIPVTAEDTGLSPGQDVNASLTLDLITDVAYSAPGYGIGGYYPVSGEGSAWVEISSPGPVVTAPAGLGVPVVPTVLVGGGVALLAFRLTLFRAKRD